MFVETRGLTIRQISSDLAQGRYSAVDITLEFLRRARDSRTNAMTFVCDKSAIEAAKAADERLQSGSPRGLMDGVPIAIKENIAVKGMSDTCCSAARSGMVADFDAQLVTALKSSGAVIIGKTNMDEFAMGSTNRTSAFGACLNPHDLSRVSGGSSGGSAAAVADGVCAAALGSDTGGSIRQPASFCGVVGYKPHQSTIKQHGVLPLAPSLDAVGTLTVDALDAAIVTDACSGERVFEAAQRLVARGFRARAALIEGFGVPEGLGALPVVSLGMAAADITERIYRIISRRQNYLSLQKYDLAQCGDEVRARASRGMEITQQQLDDAIALQRSIARRADEILQSFDLIITASTPTEAFLLAESREELLAHADDYLCFANLADLSAISVPCGARGGLPMGAHLVARRGNEPLLIAAAQLLQANNLSFL